VNPFNPADLAWQKWPPEPLGGQHVGTGSNGVRLTHLPTGIAIEVGASRSQHHNRQVALDALLGALTSPSHRD